VTPLRFGLIGCGFWSRFQLAAWRELPGVECVAVCDVDPGKARALAARFGISRRFSDAAGMIAETRPDFVDIVAGVDAHRPLVECAARSGIPVIC
jgi:predicted dehydrogenase